MKQIRTELEKLSKVQHAREIYIHARHTYAFESISLVVTRQSIKNLPIAKNVSPVGASLYRKGRYRNGYGLEVDLGKVGRAAVAARITCTITDLQFYFFDTLCKSGHLQFSSCSTRGILTASRP